MKEFLKANLKPKGNGQNGEFDAKQIHQIQRKIKRKDNFSSDIDPKK